MFKIAVDLGYGYVKGINENGDKYLCRTAVGTGFNRQITKIFGSLDKSYEHLIISHNGVEKQYFIGDLAREQSRDCSSPFEKNKIDHPATKILLAAAVAKLTEGVKEPIHLVTGPPLLYAEEQRQSFIDMLSSYEAIVQFVSYGSIHICKFDKVTVFPQGAAVVYYLLKQHKELAEPGSVFVIIEPGHKTTEILPFEITDGFRIRPIDGFATTIETGMHMVESALENAFYGKTGSRLNRFTLDKVMRNDRPIHFDGNIINLKKEKEEAKDELVRIILDEATRKLGDHIELARKLVFCGGVSEDPYIKSKFLSFDKKSIVLPDSQFANAIGMLEVAKMVELKEEKRKVI